MFPGFWMNSQMIHVQELPMTSTVAYIGLSVHVGKCSIPRLLFSQGLAGGKALPSCL